MRARSAPATDEAPPAGADAATPRPDLRGFRGGQLAVLKRVEAQLKARRVHGLVAGFVAGFVVGIALVAAGVPDVAAVLAAAAVNFAVTVWLPPLLLATADRRLLGIVNRSAVAALMAWRRAYGTAPIPRKEEEQLLWIAGQSETTTDPEAIAIETSFLLLFGRHAAARERAERIPDDTPWRRFDREMAFAAVEFDAGGPGDLGSARAAAEAMQGPRRALVVGGLALEEAGRAVIQGTAWGPIIARAAATAGSPKLINAGAAIGRALPIMPVLLVSELALGALLYVVASGAA